MFSTSARSRRQRKRWRRSLRRFLTSETSHCSLQLVLHPSPPLATFITIQISLILCTLCRLSLFTPTIPPSSFAFTSLLSSLSFIVYPLLSQLFEDLPFLHCLSPFPTFVFRSCTFGNSLDLLRTSLTRSFGRSRGTEEGYYITNERRASESKFELDKHFKVSRLFFKLRLVSSCPCLHDHLHHPHVSVSSNFFDHRHTSSTYSSSLTYSHHPLSSTNDDHLYYPYPSSNY